MRDKVYAYFNFRGFYSGSREGWQCARWGGGFAAGGSSESGSMPTKTNPYRWKIVSVGRGLPEEG